MIAGPERVKPCIGFRIHYCLCSNRAVEYILSLTLLYQGFRWSKWVSRGISFCLHFSTFSITHQWKLIACIQVSRFLTVSTVPQASGGHYIPERKELYLQVQARFTSQHGLCDLEEEKYARPGLSIICMSDSHSFKILWSKEFIAFTFLATYLLLKYN